MNDYLFGKELSIRFTVRVFRERLSICVCVSFPFGNEDGLWDLIVSEPGHCLSIYFVSDRDRHKGLEEFEIRSYYSYYYMPLNAEKAHN